MAQQSQQLHKTPQAQQPQQANSQRLRSLNNLARIMDSQFSIPGTSMRFGVDSIIGLVPGVGDLISLGISGYLISSAVKNGASNFVIARMMLNSGLDAIIGSIPILGDIFDVAYKANMRNVRLLQQHYGTGRHRGSSKKVIIPVIIVLLALLAGFIWLCYKLIVWLF